MFCGKCGTKVDVPNDSNELFVICPNCKSEIKIAKKPIAINTASSLEKQSVEDNSISKETQKNQALAANSVTNDSPKKIEAKIITAGKLQVGTNCSICKQPINLGDKIYICNYCKSTSHENCWLEHGGCPVAECSGKLTPEERAAQAPTKYKLSSDPKDMVKCKWCMEPMRRGAAFCPSCGQSQSKNSVDEDDNSYYKYDDSAPLEKKEYALIFVVPLIGFKMPNWGLLFVFFSIPVLIGLFHLFSGDKSKGKRFIKTSLIYELLLLSPTIIILILALLSSFK